MVERVHDTTRAWLSSRDKINEYEPNINYFQSQYMYVYSKIFARCNANHLSDIVSFMTIF